jgi:hypothetical protein
VFFGTFFITIRCIARGACDCLRMVFYLDDFAQIARTWLIACLIARLPKAQGALYRTRRDAAAQLLPLSFTNERRRLREA